MSNHQENPFGDMLLELRQKADVSMRRAAAAIGKSVVYYSDVENGRRPPFSPKSIEFTELAALLNTSAATLRDAALAARGSFQVDLDEVGPVGREAMLLLARHIHEEGVDDATWQRLRDALRAADSEEAPDA